MCVAAFQVVVRDVNYQNLGLVEKLALWEEKKCKFPPGTQRWMYNWCESEWFMHNLNLAVEFKQLKENVDIAMEFVKSNAQPLLQAQQQRAAASLRPGPFLAAIESPRPDQLDQPETVSKIGRSKAEKVQDLEGRAVGLDGGLGLGGSKIGKSGWRGWAGETSSMISGAYFFIAMLVFAVGMLCGYKWLVQQWVKRRRRLTVRTRSGD